MSILSRYIRDILDREGMSQNELARLSGVGQGYMSEIMNGKIPTKKTLDKLRPYLKVTQKDLYRMAGYIDIPDDAKYAELKAVSLKDEYIEKGLSEADIRRILDSVVDALNKAKE